MEDMNCGWDVNAVSYMNISKLIEILRYSDFKSLYHRHPKLALSRGLRPLNCEADVLNSSKMSRDMKLLKYMWNIYLTHQL